MRWVPRATSVHWASCFTRCSRVASPTRGQPSRSFGSSVCCARPSRPVPRYTIEQFMNTPSMVGASFSPDERAILVTSNQSGVFNAYEIPAAGGKPQARTHSTTDGIFTVGYLPHDRRVLYLQGDGGNENDHLYLLDTTGTARDLTPGDSLKAVFGDWTGDDSSFYYATNGRDRRFFDVYEMPVATLTPRL